MRDESQALTDFTHRWLEPLGDQPCGVDVEYEVDYLEFEKAVTGRPASQWDEGQPPDWRRVRSLTESLFERTRDLRVLVGWTRACLNLDGLPSLDESLQLMVALLDRYWDTLHPVPDEGDACARLNALSSLTHASTGLVDLRAAVVISSRLTGQLTLRDLLVALGKLPARESETPYTEGQLRQMFAETDADLGGLRRRLGVAADSLGCLDRLLHDRVGYNQAPDFQAFSEGIDVVLGLLPDVEAGAQAFAEKSTAVEAAETDGVPLPTPAGAKARHGPLTTIETRAEALRAIDLVCDYLERTEPTNPAQLLLRRARKLINKNFLELVRELAPDALSEVARIMGVDPESIAPEE
ncbi:type VI secretion system protein TssA [Derxia gummosa]|uniref:Type VI secretion system protein TssA n=1 Tax=Derxia gummosa DSM 723 TaxID=1121388 RepID=A0A8B6X2G6_9BURK|nr:type VI secretion system protein TssA [Derxia gummosa]